MLDWLTCWLIHGIVLCSRVNLINWHWALDDRMTARISSQMDFHSSANFGIFGIHRRQPTQFSWHFSSVLLFPAIQNSFWIHEVCLIMPFIWMRNSIWVSSHAFKLVPRCFLSPEPDAKLLPSHSRSIFSFTWHKSQEILSVSSVAARS